MNLKKKWTLMICILSCLAGNAQEKYSKVRIPVSSPAVKSFIYDKLNLDHYEHDGNAITAVLNSSEMSKLRHSGYAFDLLTDDVVRTTTLLNRNISPVENVAVFQSTTCQKLSSIISTPASFGSGGSLRHG